VIFLLSISAVYISLNDQCISSQTQFSNTGDQYVHSFGAGNVAGVHYGYRATSF